MDLLKEKIEEIIEKIKKDKNFAEDFKKNPVKTIEELAGIDLPNDQINALIKGVKAKIDLDAVTGLLDSDGDGKVDIGNLGKLGGLFGKK